MDNTVARDIVKAVESLDRSLTKMGKVLERAFPSSEAVIHYADNMPFRVSPVQTTEADAPLMLDGREIGRIKMYGDGTASIAMVSSVFNDGWIDFALNNLLVGIEIKPVLAPAYPKETQDGQQT